MLTAVIYGLAERIFLFIFYFFLTVTILNSLGACTAVKTGKEYSAQAVRMKVTLTGLFAPPASHRSRERSSTRDLARTAAWFYCLGCTIRKPGRDSIFKQREHSK